LYFVTRSNLASRPNFSKPSPSLRKRLWISSPRSNLVSLLRTMILPAIEFEPNLTALSDPPLMTQNPRSSS
jgi:hypothetical protein